MDINGIGSSLISSFTETNGVESNTATQQTSSSGGASNVLTQFTGGDSLFGDTPIGGIFNSFASIFGGNKSNTPNNFDLGAIIGAIFDNPVFKLFEGIFGGGKKLEPIAVPPLQGQAVAQDAQGSLTAERAGATSTESNSNDGIDLNSAVGSGFSLADIDDIDNTSSSESAANLPQLEDDK